MIFHGNASVGKSVAAFTAADDAATMSIKTFDGEIFTQSIVNDIWSVGFCRLNDLHLSDISAMPSGIAILPVDRNGNGKIDDFEKIYDNPESLIRGAWTGKYPHSLCGSIYAVSALKPENRNTLAFLRWVISEGDQLLSPSGFSQLAGIEKESGLNALGDPNMNGVQPAKDQISYSWLIILVILIISGGIVTALLASRRRRSAIPSGETERETRVLNERVITAPGGLYFDKSHIWAFMERDGLVRIGIDDFLQHVTGTITGIRLRETGEYVKRGEKILTVIRDGKQLILYAPVSGVIKSQNTDLYVDPSIINSSPYTDGWIYLVEPRNWVREIQMMFATERFREWITDEFTRLKDFLAAASRSNNPAYAEVILQDGGELKDNLLEALAPEVWEDFQINFIDKSR
jgi:glycine cleavage system H lipoate-binding protein